MNINIKKPIYYYIYILRCCDDVYYVGQTAYIINRMFEHISGKGSFFTKNNPPCELVHLEVRYSRREAFIREAELIYRVSKNNNIPDFTLSIPYGFAEIFHRVMIMVKEGGTDKHWKNRCNKEIDVPINMEWEDNVPINK